jgi:Spy/CpxP family protein refolding chaperone
MNILKDTDFETYRNRGRGRRAFWILIMLAIIVVVLSTTSGCLHSNQRGGTYFNDPERQLTEKQVDRALSYVEASDTQRVKIKAIIKESEPDLRNYREQNQVLHVKLVDALLTETLDPGELAKLRKEVVALTDDVLNESLALMIDISYQLTPDQRATLINKWQQRHN